MPILRYFGLVVKVLNYQRDVDEAEVGREVCLRVSLSSLARQILAEETCRRAEWLTWNGS